MITRRGKTGGLYIDGEACSGHGSFKPKERNTKMGEGVVVDEQL